MTHFSTRIASATLAFSALVLLPGCGGGTEPFADPAKATTPSPAAAPAYPPYTKGERLTANTRVGEHAWVHSFSTAVTSLEACEAAGRELLYITTPYEGYSSMTTCQAEDGQSRARFLCQNVKQNKALQINCSPQ